MSDASASQFLPYLKDSFTVRVGALRSTKLVLAEVDERSNTKNVAQFSLTFHARPQDLLSDGTYEFTHRSLGSFHLFIVKIGIPSDRRSVYEACFSRHTNRRDKQNPAAG